MSHNPPRVWFTEAHQRGVERAAKRKLAQWQSLDDLADKMLARAAQGKNVVLSPGTAEVVGRWVKARCDDKKCKQS